jgi:drug/metabolite transporter (DMT)-like permease
MNGAGGTKGGVGQFLIGFIMMVAGGYLFLDAVHVVNQFSLGRGLFMMSNFQVTGGMVLVPFVFGIGMIFYNSKNYLGWFLALASMTMLFFGVITSIDFRLRTMSAFELLTILVLFVGGIGLFLNSLKNFETKAS